ncbi:MAG: hypothetical protein ABIH52_01355 [Candidatus Aenigmatarchaeota archaeon]
MNILIVVTMIIVFISAFFIILTVQGVVNASTCPPEECEMSLATSVFGISTVISFLLICILAVYIVMKTLSSADIGESKTL